MKRVLDCPVAAVPLATQDKPLRAACRKCGVSVFAA